MIKRHFILTHCTQDFVLTLLVVWLALGLSTSLSSRSSNMETTPIQRCSDSSQLFDRTKQVKQNVSQSRGLLLSQETICSVSEQFVPKTLTHSRFTKSSEQQINDGAGGKDQGSYKCTRRWRRGGRNVISLKHGMWFEFFIRSVRLEHVWQKLTGQSNNADSSGGM